ncbi:hypothetical protein F6P62_10025 [Streptococcus suis]|nr:hypothetical protein [Streptococcus suis]
MITHLEYQHDESLLLNYKFLASNLTSIPIIQNFKILHYQHTLYFLYSSNQEQSLNRNLGQLAQIQLGLVHLEKEGRHVC